MLSVKIVSYIVLSSRDLLSNFLHRVRNIVTFVQHGLLLCFSFNETNKCGRD